MEKSVKAVSATRPSRDIAAQCPAGQRMAMKVVAVHGASATLNGENEGIADWLERLTTNKRTCGFGLCFLYLRNVQGYSWNHKRVYRIYCELALNLRIKPKKRLKRDKP